MTPQLTPQRMLDTYVDALTTLFEECAGLRVDRDDGVFPVIRVARADGATRSWRVNNHDMHDVHRVGTEIRTWFIDLRDKPARESAWDWWHALADLHGEPA